jgi:hypothetical protein
MKAEIKRRMAKLLATLVDAADQAEYLGSTAGAYQADDFQGTEANDIAGALRDIYNAFMTGDKYNTEFEDQEFK